MCLMESKKKKKTGSFFLSSIVCSQPTCQDWAAKFHRGTDMVLSFSRGAAWIDQEACRQEGTSRPQGTVYSGVWCG